MSRSSWNCSELVGEKWDVASQKWRDAEITAMTSVASIWQDTCELIETNVIKNNTHNIQPINIYESENKCLEKAMISASQP